MSDQDRERELLDNLKSKRSGNLAAEYEAKVQELATVRLELKQAREQHAKLAELLSRFPALNELESIPERVRRLLAQVDADKNSVELTQPSMSRAEYIEGIRHYARALLASRGPAVSSLSDAELTTLQADALRLLQAEERVLETLPALSAAVAEVPLTEDARPNDPHRAALALGVREPKIQLGKPSRARR